MENHDYESGYTSKTIEVLQPPSIVTHLLDRVSANKKDFVVCCNSQCNS